MVSDCEPIEVSAEQTDVDSLLASLDHELGRTHLPPASTLLYQLLDDVVAELAFVLLAELVVKAHAPLVDHSADALWGVRQVRKSFGALYAVEAVLGAKVEIRLQ